MNKDIATILTGSQKKREIITHVKYVRPGAPLGFSFSFESDLKMASAAVAYLISLNRRLNEQQLDIQVERIR